jgi:alpha-L-rhamnosidase
MEFFTESQHLTFCRAGKTTGAILKNALKRHARILRMMSPTSLGLLLAAITLPAFAAAPSAPTNLRVDDVVNPVGTEAAPYFGWLVNDTDANEIQTRYQILVATNSSDLDANIGDVWDSGTVVNRSENHVVFAGPALVADTKYFWKVRSWDKDTNASPFSATATFVVGLLVNSDWSGAEWIKRNISVPDDYTYYRKSVALPVKTVQRATVFVTSVHKYALYVNGTLVGKGPAYAFPQFQFYNACDITSLVTPGTTNLFAIFNHWFGGGSGRPTSARGVLMKAIIHYTDGTSTNIVTDGTWLQNQATNWIVSSPSPVSRGGSGPGYVERIDARNLTTNWFTISFDDSAWIVATVIGFQPNATWTGSLLPDLTRIVETVLTPVSVTDKGGGKYIVDLGKVYSGVPSITFSNGTSGTVVGMLGGFALNGSGEIDPSQNQSVNLSYIAILNGTNFTYQAAEYDTMRYFEITNSPMAVTTSNFTFIQRNSQMNDAASTFSSSNATLNAVWGLMKQTLPVDAQEEFIDSMRQKGGFLGDGFQESLAAMQVEDERVLTRSRLNEFIESMGEFWSAPADVGRVNAAYPDVNNARDIPDYTQMFLAWVWEYYLQTGDRAFLATNYTALTNIAQYVNRSLNPTNGLITRLLGGTSSSYTNGIIDWPANMRFGYDMATVTGPGNASTVINGWAWEDYDIASRIANELGNTTDSANYRAMASALQAAMNTNLLNASGVYVDGLEPDGTQSAHASQHANAFPLSLDIVPAAQQANVASLVISSNMSVSALGILQLVRALGEANQGPALLNLYTNANQYGWAQILSLGGTATWESWTANTDGNSESHGWGAVGLDGYVRYILGVKPLTAQFEQVQIMPLDFSNSLASATGTLLTDRGTIAVEWDRNAALYHLAATIPINVTATIYVPQAGFTNMTINVDGTNVTGTLTNGYLGISGIGSGAHNIQRVLMPPPVANFSGVPTNIFATQTVTFTDASTGNITNWLWNFGDGNAVTNSSSANVPHTFTAAGNYTVTLTVSGEGGSSTNAQTAYITVKTKPVLNVAMLAGGKLMFGGTNGPAAVQYRILTTTNVALPLGSWTPVWTNVFGADGSYSYTNSLGPNPAGFFLLISP